MTYEIKHPVGTYYCINNLGISKAGDKCEVVGHDEWGYPLFAHSHIGMANFDKYYSADPQDIQWPEETRINTIPAGTMLTISTDCYSSYEVHGVFRVLKDITHEDYKRFRPADDDDYEELSGVIAQMARQGFIEDVESLELHLGDYGKLEPTIRKA